MRRRGSSIKRMCSSSDESLWTQGAREFAEKSFDHRIVKAFYDDLVPTPRDGWALRENVIGLPKDGFARIQFLAQQERERPPSYVS